LEPVDNATLVRDEYAVEPGHIPSIPSLDNNYSITSNCFLAQESVDINNSLFDQDNQHIDKHFDIDDFNLEPD